jgi:hypothetical protein
MPPTRLSKPTKPPAPSPPHAWTPQETALLQSLNTPPNIQAFLDDTPYNDDHQCRSPRRVIRDRRAHCMEGALFAAAALRFHGLGCRILDLKATRDDDHVIALYQRDNYWGAVAKSNMSGLRFREPIYKTLRELALSYFADYFNTERERTLRAYSRPLDLSRFDPTHWMTTEDDLDPIGQFLDKTPHRALLTADQIQMLSPVDQRTWDANMLGVNPKGLYWVHEREPSQT